MKPLTITIPIKPIPASRPRIRRFGKPYFGKNYTAWRKNAAKTVDTYGGSPIASPVYVDVLFAVPRAKSSKLLVPFGDGDNFEKALYDFLVRHGYLEDDKWITSAYWRKRFLPHGETGYTHITIKDERDDIDL